MILGEIFDDWGQGEIIYAVVPPEWEELGGAVRALLPRIEAFSMEDIEDAKAEEEDGGDPITEIPWGEWLGSALPALEAAAEAFWDPECGEYTECPDYSAAWVHLAHLLPAALEAAGISAEIPEILQKLRQVPLEGNDEEIATRAARTLGLPEE